VGVLCLRDRDVVQSIILKLIKWVDLDLHGSEYDPVVELNNELWVTIQGGEIACVAEELWATLQGLCSMELNELHRLNEFMLQLFFNCQNIYRSSLALMYKEC
jgi:hypothetical protein